MRRGKRNCAIEAVLAGVMILLLALCLTVFPNALDFASSKSKAIHIMTRIRLPEALAAISVGLSLGMSGAVMQIVLNNELASPFTLGVSSSAAAGATVSIVLFGGVLTEVFATAFAFGSLCLLLMISSVMGGSRKNIVIAGISVGFLFDSVRTIILSASPPDGIYNATFWTMGSLVLAGLSDSVRLLVIWLIAFLIVMVMLRDAGLLQQGDDVAMLHGVNAKVLRMFLILACSVVASLSVSLVGIIGFVGLVSPHAARFIGSESPSEVVVSSSLIGGVFLLVSSVLSKIFTYPAILPISAVTSALGIVILFALSFAFRSRWI